MSEEKSQADLKRKHVNTDNGETDEFEQQKTKKSKNIDLQILKINRTQFFLTEEDINLEIESKMSSTDIKSFFIILVEQKNEKEILKKVKIKNKEASLITLKIPTSSIDKKFNFSKKYLIKFENLKVDFGNYDEHITLSKMNLKDSEFYKQFDNTSLNYVLLLYLAYDQKEDKLEEATKFLKRVGFDKNEVDSKGLKLSTWNSFFIHGDFEKIEKFGKFIKQYIHEQRWGFNFNFLQHLSCKKGMEKVIRFILEDDLIDVNEKDNIGNTPLFYSELYQFNKITQVLLENGADKNIKNNEGQSIEEYVEEKREELLTSQDEEEDF